MSRANRTNGSHAEIVQALSFFVPGKVPSVNRMYGTTRDGKRFLEGYAVKFKSDFVLIARNAAALTGWRYRPGWRLRVVFTYVFGHRKPVDVDNCIKITMDSLKEALGFDDNRRIVAEVTARDGGVDTRDPGCHVEVEVL